MGQIVLWNATDASLLLSSLLKFPSLVKDFSVLILACKPLVYLTWRKYHDLLLRWLAMLFILNDFGAALVSDQIFLALIRIWALHALRNVTEMIALVRHPHHRGQGIARHYRPRSRLDGVRAAEHLQRVAQDVIAHTASHLGHLLNWEMVPARQHLLAIHVASASR